jgi:hypothetical protein
MGTSYLSGKLGGTHQNALSISHGDLDVRLARMADPGKTGRLPETDRDGLQSFSRFWALAAC